MTGSDDDAFLEALQEASDQSSTTLHFSHRRELTAVPSVIKALRTHLEVLHLDNNYALQTLPPAIGDLGRLRWLDAAYCALSEIPAEIGQLSRLERLHLNNNRLMSLPIELWKLKKLEELHVENNSLRMLPGGLLFLSDLREVHLENNPLLTLPEVNGAAVATLVEPRTNGTDCASCCVRSLNNSVFVTFNAIAEHRDVPFVHYVCSEDCQRHLQQRVVAREEAYALKHNINIETRAHAPLFA